MIIKEFENRPNKGLGQIEKKHFKKSDQHFHTPPLTIECFTSSRNEQREKE